MEMSSKLVWKIRNTQHPDKLFLALDSYTVAYSSFGHFYWQYGLYKKEKKNYGVTENVNQIQTRIAHRTRQAANL